MRPCTSDSSYDCNNSCQAIAKPVDDSGSMQTILSLEERTARFGRMSDEAALSVHLSRMLALAEADSERLRQCIAENPAGYGAEEVRAARRCHQLIQDALVTGAIELAATLGVPDRQLPR